MHYIKDAGVPLRCFFVILPSSVYYLVGTSYSSITGFLELDGICFLFEESVLIIGNIEYSIIFSFFVHVRLLFVGGNVNSWNL